MVSRARDLSRELLGNREERWEHTQEVAAQARLLGEAMLADEGQREQLAAAAWLHDIGYGDALRIIGFHPLDGALFLQRQAWPAELVGLVAHHSGAWFVAEVIGLADAMEQHWFSDGEVMDLLTYADQTTGPGGIRLGVEQRLEEMLRRHGPGSANARAHPRRAPYLRSVAGRVEARLAVTAHAAR